MKPVAENLCIFSFTVQSALINSPGQIFLKLRISTPSKKSLLKDIVVQSGDSDEEVRGHTFATDAVSISEEHQSSYHQFIDNSVTFHLPKGLCRDETGSDVTLHLSAWDRTKNVEIAESSLLVYPRQNKDESRAARGDEVYRHAGELLLVKKVPESIAIFIGKLKYEAHLRLMDSPSPVPSTPTPVPSPTLIPSPEPELSPELVPEPEPTPEPTPPPPREQEPKEPTPPPPPPPPTVKVHVPRKTEKSRPSGMVAPPNQEELVILVHAASGLPTLPNGSVPCPYVLGKIQADSERKRQGSMLRRGWQGTQSTVNTTTNPQWEDVVCCKIPAVDRKSTQADVLQLKIVDMPSKIEISTFELPVSLFQPFHHYHLDLVQASVGSPHPIHLFVSVYRKLSSLPESGDFSFCGLEVRLLSLDRPLPSSVGSLMAVAKIVPDYQNYRDAFREHTDHLSVQPTTVECPVPHPSSFLTSVRGKHQGYAQLWLADSSRNIHPRWDHSFVFCDERELASMFVSTAALVIELYSTSSSFDGATWSPHSPMGLAVVLLDNRVYNALTNDGGRLGVRVPHIPLQACSLPAHGKQTHSLSLVLRLLTSKVPDQLPSVSNLSTLPALEGIPSPDPPSPVDLPPANPTWGGLNPEPAVSPPCTPLPVPLYDVVVLSSRKFSSLKGEELPPADALQSILQAKPQDRVVQPGDKTTSTKGLIPTRLPPPLTEPEPQPAASVNGPNDQTLMNLIDSQQREIDSYRQAMKRMGEEVIQLQDALTRLETDNSRLRQQASMYEDTTRAMVTDARLEGMSKAELLENYVTLKRSLSKQVSETANYREKLLHAQNDLIKHNDREKKHLDQQEAYVAQAKLLQERQEKVKKLERACREQERALEKMDKALVSAKTAKQGVRFKEDDQERSVLSAENARLKAEIEHHRATSSPKGGSADEAEKMKMQFMLERAEGRVSSLERELLDKAKEWGKEKASMSFRSEERQRQHALPPLPYYDRGKPHQDYNDPYAADRSYGNRRPRLGYGTPTRLSPLY